MKYRFLFTSYTFHRLSLLRTTGNEKSNTKVLWVHIFLLPLTSHGCAAGKIFCCSYSRLITEWWPMSCILNSHYNLISRIQPATRRTRQTRHLSVLISQKIVNTPQSYNRSVITLIAQWYRLWLWCWVTGHRISQEVSVSSKLRVDLTDKCQMIRNLSPGFFFKPSSTTSQQFCTIHYLNHLFFLCHN